MCLFMYRHPLSNNGHNSRHSGGHLNGPRSLNRSKAGVTGPRGRSTARSRVMAPHRNTDRSRVTAPHRNMYRRAADMAAGSSTTRNRSPGVRRTSRAAPLFHGVSRVTARISIARWMKRRNRNRVASGLETRRRTITVHLMDTELHPTAGGPVTTADPGQVRDFLSQVASPVGAGRSRGRRDRKVS